MKNIQVIDGAENSAYDIFACTEEEFGLIFPLPFQNIEFIEDLQKRIRKKKIDELFLPIWDRPVRKCEAHGINGTLFYELTNKKKYYPNKQESDLDIDRGRGRGWNHG